MQTLNYYLVNISKINVFGKILKIISKICFDIYVHILFKNYVIFGGDPLPPPCHLPVIRLGYLAKQGEVHFGLKPVFPNEGPSLKIGRVRVILIFDDHYCHYYNNHHHHLAVLSRSNPIQNLEDLALKLDELDKIYYHAKFQAPVSKIYKAMYISLHLSSQFSRLLLLSLLLLSPPK